MTPARRARVAAAASILLMLAVAAPVWAAPSATLTSPPGDPATFTAPGSITGKVEGDAARKEKVTSAVFSLSVAPAGEGCATEIPEDQRNLSGINAPSVDFSLDPAFPCNGDYELMITGSYESPVLGALLGGLTSEDFEARATFGVAIPPIPVQGLKASYDPASKKVSLSWSKSPEPDTFEYRIERKPAGRDKFAQLGAAVTKTEFTDTLVAEELYRYRVIPVRNGPRGSKIAGSFVEAPSITVGPDRPDPVSPDTTIFRPPPPADTGGSGAGGSGRGGSGSGGSGGGGGGSPQISRGPGTTIDDGFGENLPFDPSRTTTTIPGSPVPPEDAAVLAIDDDPTAQDDRRATMVPIAGGLALMMGAVHLRLLSKRAGEPELPVYGSRALP